MHFNFHSELMTLLSSNLEKASQRDNVTIFLP